MPNDPRGFEAFLRLIDPLRPLSGSLEWMLANGGDTRLALDPATQLNGYGCRPFPRPEAFTFASSTATSISDRAYAGVAGTRQVLLREAQLLGVERSIDTQMDRQRLELKQILGLEDSGCEIVFLSLGSSDDLISAVLGPGGLMSQTAAPRVLIDCSTVSTEASAQVREKIADRGTALLAAPVMGNPRVVAAGKMTAAVSGPRDAFDLAMPYLDMLGQGVTYVGEGEAARTVKLCHNLMLGVVAQTLAEITVLAEKSGISRHAFLGCLNNSVMGSLFTGYKTPAYVNLDFEPTFTATLLRKDFDLGLAAAREREVPMPVAATVHQLIQGLIGRGYGGADFAALLQQQAESAGLTLVSEHAEVSDGLDT